MTNDMPEKVYVGVTNKNRFICGPVPDGDTEYTRSDLCVPQDVLRQVADALEYSESFLPERKPYNTPNDFCSDDISSAIAALQPYLKEKP